MKYISLEKADSTKQLKKEDCKHISSVGSTTMSPPSPKSTPRSQNIRTLARLEASRTAYLALTPSDNFDTALYKAVEILSGTTNPSGTSGTAIFRLAFPSQYCNKFGTVHGGAIATLLDGVSQCATAVVDISTRDMLPMRGIAKGSGGGGATKALQIGYLRPVAVRETVTITCEVLMAGGKDATIRSTLKRDSDGEILAISTMDKEGYERAKL